MCDRGENPIIAPRQILQMGDTWAQAASSTLSTLVYFWEHSKITGQIHNDTFSLFYSVAYFYYFEKKVLVLKQEC